MKNIQAKLTVFILAIFLVAMSALGGLNYREVRSVISRDIAKSMGDLATGSATSIGDWLDACKLELAGIAVAPVLKSGKTEEIASYLTYLSKENKRYEHFGYIAPDGNFIDNSGVTGNLGNRSYFQQAMKGDPAVEAVSRATGGKQVAMLAVPVKADGKVTGVLFGVISMDDISNRVLQVKVGETGYAFVVQGDGLRIIHPDKEMAMKSNPLKDADAEPAMKQLTKWMVKGEKGLTVLKSSQGVEKYYAYAPVPGVNWSLAVNVPVAEVTGELSSLSIISVATTGVVLVLTGIIIAWFARRFVKPLKELEAVANRIAAGDITLTKLNVNSNDEIGRLGQSFEQMARNLHGLIQKILWATDQVAASSEELTASSEQVAQAANHIATSITTVAAGADEQLGAVNETSVVVEQMAASIQQIAVNSNQVAAQSAQAAGKAQDGDRAVLRAVAQMEKIKDTVITSARVVAKLGEQSKEIGQIVDTISGIADQTNLLALNAAIEAARAGEQGRGFAVVAEEVRKLAEQSQEAAKKIAELIGEIQGDTDKAVVAMNDGTREVKTGAEVVNAAGDAFREITGLVTQVSGQVEEISAAMQQMTAGSQQIVGSVKKIDELSIKSVGESQNVSAAAEEQLASMEEISTSSKSLTHLSQDLQAAVAGFRV